MAFKLQAAEDLTLDDALVRELKDKLLNVLLCNELMLDDDVATGDDVRDENCNEEWDEKLETLLEDKLLNELLCNELRLNDDVATGDDVRDENCNEEWDEPADMSALDTAKVDGS